MMTASGFASGWPSGPENRFEMGQFESEQTGKILPSVIVRPPRLFKPVTAQSPRTHISPKLFGKSKATGFGIVTSCPSRLSQKSIPNLSGCSVASVTSMRLLLLGTARKPSPPVSSAESCCVGGLRSLPMITGSTTLLWDATSILAGLSISVIVRSLGEPLERNSATRPDKDTMSPGATWAMIVSSSVKILSPLETRISATGAPEIQNPLGP